MRVIGRAGVGLILVLVTTAPTGRADPPATAESPRVQADTTPSFFSRHRRSLLWGTALTAAGAGIVALSVRHHANTLFDDYRETADPERIADLYTRVGRLDDRAAIAFAVADLSFVAAMVLGFFVEPPPVASAWTRVAAPAEPRVPLGGVFLEPLAPHPPEPPR